MNRRAGTRRYASVFPAALLSFNPLRQIKSSEAGCAKHYPARCALLRFDFSLRLKAAGWSFASLSTPSSWSLFQLCSSARLIATSLSPLNWNCETTRGGDPLCKEWGSERASSPTTQIAQKNSTTGERSERGSALHTPPPRTGFFKAR